MNFDPLTIRMKANTLTIKPSHLLWEYVTLHSIYRILHFKHYKNINSENSYLIEILFKWNDSIFKKKIQWCTQLHLFPFESLKSFEQKKSWMSLFNNISMTIHLIFLKIKNEYFFVNIIILLMLSYFQLLYEYFSLI